MSYRALVTVVSPTGEKFDLVTLLGDETWDEGEKLAEQLGREKSYNDAILVASSLLDENTYIKPLESDEHRREYVCSWADEHWALAYTLINDWTNLVIMGHDAVGEPMFMRKRAWSPDF